MPANLAGLSAYTSRQGGGRAMKIFNMVLFGWPIFPKEVEVGQPGSYPVITNTLIQLLVKRCCKISWRRSI